MNRKMAAAGMFWENPVRAPAMPVPITPRRMSTPARHRAIAAGAARAPPIAPAPIAASKTPDPKAPPFRGPDDMTTKIGDVRLPKVTAAQASALVDRKVRVVRVD